MEKSPEQNAIKALLSSLLASSDGRKVFEDILWSAGLRTTLDIERFKFERCQDLSRLHNSKMAIILDTETTGTGADAKLVQLAMLKVRYDNAGIVSVDQEFNEYTDPGVPIPAEATNINGITNAMVAGKAIHDREVCEFIKGATAVICHNAEFDRQVVERELPNVGFEKHAFQCSLKQIDWKSRGMSSSVLEFLAFKSGYTFNAHDALSDVKILPFILNQDNLGRETAFEEMNSWSMSGALLVVAKDAPFAKKELLKKRGYIWSSEGREYGGEKAWYRIIKNHVELRADEATFLKGSVYGYHNLVLPAYILDDTIRYSARKPENRIDFDLDDEIFRPDDPGYHEYLEIQRSEAASAERDYLPSNNDH